jgi:uracil-DNA glycosylase family 4
VGCPPLSEPHHSLYGQPSVPLHSATSATVGDVHLKADSDSPVEVRLTQYPDFGKGAHEYNFGAMATLLGCECCHLNKVPGIVKIMGAVEGKDIFVWAQSPGRDENEKKQELVGRSGQFLWAELKRIGVTRERCDIQNVVRCFPADWVERVGRPPKLKMRDPTNEEIRCCSLHTSRAIEKQKAKLHLVFGKKAQEELLGAEYEKDNKSFWSEKLNGNVVCLAHPSYFIYRGYGGDKSREPNAQLLEFRELLNEGLRRLLDSPIP